MLVRVYTRPLVKDGDVIVPPILPLEVDTMNRRGKLYGVENPYPFFNKAVVVSVPDLVQDLKPGDIVTIKGSYKFVEVFGKGDDAFIRVHGYMHPEDAANYTEYPTDPQDENYGYFLIPNHLIDVII